MPKQFGSIVDADVLAAIKDRPKNTNAGAGRLSGDPLQFGTDTSGRLLLGGSWSDKFEGHHRPERLKTEGASSSGGTGGSARRMWEPRPTGR